MIKNKGVVIGQVVNLGEKIYDDELEAKDVVKSVATIAAVELATPLAVSTALSMISGTVLATPLVIAAAPVVAVVAVVTGIGCLFNSTFDW